MKKTKILTVLSVLLAMGITACNGGGKSSDAPKSEEPPVSQSESPKPSSEDPKPSSEDPKPSSSEAPKPEKDKTGHIWGANADVAGDAENGLAPYKRAVCTEEDNAVKYTVNQSAFVLASGSTRKSGTPEGYMKLTSDKMSFSFKFNSDKFLKGKVYLYGCMDSYSSNYQKTFCYYNNKPNVELKVNGEAVDVSAQAKVTYQDIYGPDSVEGNLSNENYALLGDVVLQKGVNEIVYTRVQTMNTLVKDIVFVGEEIDNEWSEPQAVAGDKDAGLVGYKKSTNLLNGDVKLEINALDGTFAEGSSNKDGTEEGYLKLSSNGNSISWKFNYDSAAIGSLSEIGFMDAFSSNHDVLYSWTSTSGDHKPTLEGNLRATINDNRIDRSAYLNIRAEDLTKDGDNTVFAAEKNYSPLTLLPVGNIVLKNGANVISFERLGSYNYVFNTLVLVVKNSATEFVVEETLSSDDAGHFNKVTGTNVVFNRVAHTLVADESKTDVAATCSKEGAKYEKCTVCNHEVTTVLEKIAHTWVADDSKEDVVATTCDGHGIHYEKCSVCNATREVETPSPVAHTWVDGTAVKNSDNKDVIPVECSVCHKAGAKMNENDYSSMEGSDTTPDALRPSQGKPITYKIVVSKAGKYSLEFGMFCKSNGGVKMSSRGFAVKVNDVDEKVTIDGETTPDALGMTATNAVQIELCSEITLKEGENTIAITCAGYRLHYKGNLVVREK